MDRDFTEEEIKLIEKIEDSGRKFDPESKLSIQEQLDVCNIIEDGEAVRENTNHPTMSDDVKSLSRKFFAICKQAGFRPVDAKERAKKKFNLEHFYQITKDQLDQLIAVMNDYFNSKLVGTTVTSAPPKPVQTEVTDKYENF